MRFFFRGILFLTNELKTVFGNLMRHSSAVKRHFESISALLSTRTVYIPIIKAQMLVLGAMLADAVASVVKEATEIK